MENITTTDFFEKLNSGNLNPPAKLLGFVKKSEKDLKHLKFEVWVLNLTLLPTKWKFFFKHKLKGQNTWTYNEKFF